MLDYWRALDYVYTVVFLRLLLKGCKHRVSEGVFHIGGRGFVCQIMYNTVNLEIFMYPFFGLLNFRRI